MANTIDEKTKLPLGLVWAGLATAVGIAFYAGQLGTRILNRVEALEQKVVAESWDRADMADWSRELQSKNQGLIVPVVNAKPKDKHE